MVFILNALGWTACSFVFLVQKSLNLLQREYDAALPPFRLQLLPSSDVVWAVSKSVRRLREDLIFGGFISAGTYDIQEIPGTHCMAFVHEASAVIAVIAGTCWKTWLEISTVLTDGWSVSISSAADFALPQRPGHRVLRVSTANARVMHDRVLYERGNARALPISREMVRALLEQQHARHMNWLAERGGYTREEICRAILRGKNPNDRDVFLLRENSVCDALAHWWKLQPNAPAIAPKPFQDWITIVHDDMCFDSLEDLFGAAIGAWDGAIETVPGRRSPREIFALLNRLRGEPLVKIYQKATPLEADFYCPRALLEEHQGVTEVFAM